MTMTSKQRMLNAYRGVFSDRWPVAPEFWYYYPAKVLGVDMIQFQREIPLWRALQTTFKKYGTEGWGIAFVQPQNPEITVRSSFDKMSATQYREVTTLRTGGREFGQAQSFDVQEPSWIVEYPVKDEADLPILVDAHLSPRISYDFTAATDAWRAVGDDYLLEFYLGAQFFDFLAGFMGFENTLMYFMSQDPGVLERWQKQYTEFQLELVRRACRDTPFESFCIGCAYSCNSLIGPHLWRRWDKPYVQAIADELHRHGRVLHIHFHGRSLETVADFAQMDLDCVCPFERPPGGDVEGLEGLKTVRRLLGGKVTMNGNVHTVETLIRGTPDQVRAEVRQIKEAFTGEPRMILGTGDQVGRETPEENILAMIEEAKGSS